MTNYLPVIYTGNKRWGRKIYQFTNVWAFMYSSSNFYIDMSIPAGFETDFASIPWPLHYLLPSDGPWRRAAAVHDYLCEKKVCRFLADAMFRHVMHEDKVRGRLVLYYTVRLWWQIWGRWFQ